MASEDELEELKQQIENLKKQVAESDRQRQEAEERTADQAMRSAVIAELGRHKVPDALRESLYVHLKAEGKVIYEDGQAHYAGLGFPEPLERGIERWVKENPAVKAPTGQTDTGRRRYTPSTKPPMTAQGDVDWDSMADNVNLRALTDAG